MNADTAAILVTDVVGSSASWEELGDAFRAVLARHDAILREALEAHQGYEILTEGDSFRIAFPSARHAAAFATRAFAALRQADLNGCRGPLMLRMGLAVGPVLTRPDPRTGRLEHLGPTVHEAVRIGWAAAPGQLLMTGRARADLDAPTRALGEHAVPGLAGDHALWQLGEADHGPLRTSPGRGGNLPAPVHGFVGRRAELAQISAYIEAGHRLLTLHGPAGVGKTRVALQAGRALTGRLPRAWLCDLTEAVDLDGALSAVGRALELAAGPAPEAQLGQALAGRGPLLLILDNAERAAGPLGALLGRWLAAAPQLVALVTSRVPLGAPDEQVLEIDTLPPDEAAQLLEGLSPTLGASPDAAALLDRLDRLPLAIELAAARGRSMTARQILDRLNQRFRLLSAGLRGGPGRHGTLRAALDWSWELLGPGERDALVQLTAFEGGFTLRDGLAVLGRGAEGPARLQLLVDHSLLRLDPTTGRYGALLSVVEHAAERAPEDRRAAEIQHGAHFARLGTVGHPEALFWLGGRTWGDELVPELPNLSAACRRALGRGDGEMAAATGLAALSALEVAGELAEGARLAERLRSGAAPADPTQGLALRLAWARALHATGESARALDALDGETDPGATAVLRAGVHHLRGDALLALGQPQAALEALQRAADLSAPLQPPSIGAAPLTALGQLLTRLGRTDEALAALLEARDRLSARPGSHLLAQVEGGICLIHKIRGDLGRAVAGYRALLEGAREGHERPAELAALGNLGNTLAAMGHLEEAAVCMERSARAARERGDRPMLARITANLAYLQLERGAQDQAARLALEAMALERAMGRPASEIYALAAVCAARACPQDPAGAEAALDEAVSALERIGHSRGLASALLARADLRSQGGQLDGAEQDLDRAQPTFGPDSEERGVALALRARLHLARGEDARPALDEAARLAAHIGVERGSRLRQMIEELGLRHPHLPRLA